jgi:hypothetical protein
MSLSHQKRGNRKRKIRLSYQISIVVNSQGSIVRCLLNNEKDLVLTLSALHSFIALKLGAFANPNYLVSANYDHTPGNLAKQHSRYGRLMPVIDNHLTDLYLCYKSYCNLLLQNSRLKF